MSKSIKYNIDDVWLAVAKAYIDNGNKYYSRNKGNVWESITGKDNKTLAISALQSKQFDEQHRVLAEKMKAHFDGWFLKVLNGTTNSFVTLVVDIIQKTECDQYEVAVMAALPNTYEREIKEEKSNEEVFVLARTSDYEYSIGKRYTIPVKIMQKIWSRNYASWIFTATDGTNLLRFWSKNDLANDNESVIIVGTVKTHGLSKQGIKETTFNRVKVVTND
jgi:hypothetical protein